MRMTSIYVLRDPRTNEVRYVGKTVKSLRARLSGHLYCAKTKNTYRDRWVMSLLDAGIVPAIEAIELAGENWADRESYWIAHFRQLGARLANHTDGGEGAPGHVHTEQFKAEQAERTRTSMTPERRAAHGEAMRKAWADPNRRARQGEATKIRMTPEMRSHLSKKVKETMTPERLAQMSEATKSRMTNERIASHRAKVKETTSNPEWRARQSIAVSRAMTPEHRAHLAAMTSASMTPERRKTIAETQERVAADPSYKEHQRVKQLEAVERRRADPEAVARRSAAIMAAWTPERRSAAAERARNQTRKEAA
jgi:hypothetical protein